MKRYKQAILSNFFVTDDGRDVRHLVEANLDIESRGDRTLCTEILTSECNYEVLDNSHLPSVCMICLAILDRRINNMPVERKGNVSSNRAEKSSLPPDSQLFLPGLVDEPETISSLTSIGQMRTGMKQPDEQIDLFI